MPTGPHGKTPRATLPARVRWVSPSAAVAEGAADLVAFGKSFIGNPDLVQRLRNNGPLQPRVQATLYGRGAAGFTDYPALEAATAAPA